jgi:hypothetical protein
MVRAFKFLVKLKDIEDNAIHNPELAPQQPQCRSCQLLGCCGGLAAANLPLVEHTKIVRGHWRMDYFSVLVFGLMGLQYSSGSGQGIEYTVFPWILGLSYLIDSVTSCYICDRALTLAPMYLHVNTALNVLTLVLNITYIALLAKLATAPCNLQICRHFAAISVLPALYKSANCYLLHQMVDRITREGRNKLLGAPLMASDDQTTMKLSPLQDAYSAL